MKKREIVITMQNSKKYNGLHFTVNHNAKMAGMCSLSTCVSINERCAKNAAIPGSICAKCFAAKQMKVFSSMQKPLIKNTEILTSSIIDPDLLPVINCLYFRFEAFGDLNNATQVINYFNICKKNPAVKFALWTKNPDFIKEAIESGHEKPENLVIILSSLFMNKQRDNVYNFIDKVFTVYDEKTIKENNIPIHCGEKSCLNCRICYEKNSISVVNERLK